MTSLDQYPARTLPTHAIAVDRLSVKRGSRTVLRNLSLSFDEGSITAIVGPSGVGKSTLMNVLNGLLEPDKGVVSFSGMGYLQSKKDFNRARRGIATIFQDHALIDRLPAIENVLLGMADTRHPLSPLPWPDQLRMQAAMALKDVGLLDRATTRTGNLSGGEKQRVGIARALVRKPKLLLGDEPFASVDPVLAKRLGGEFRQLVARDRLTVILVLHQLHLARQLADRIVGLNDGQIVFDGTANQFDDKSEALIFATNQKEMTCSIN